MIELEHASRWYGQVIGINDVTCAIGPGITALLGPNGAGKSTLIKLVTGQLRPTTGSVRVLGMRPFANGAVYRRLGYTPEIENSYDEMTGRQLVRMLAHMSGLERGTLEARVAEVLELVGMTSAADRQIGGYSKGMRQRIKVAQALVHDPEILMLDEPFNGLDPVARREMTQLLHEQAERNKTIVISSHILYEVEQMTHRILLMNRGRLLAMGDVFQIRSLIDAHPHRIRIESPQSRELAQRLLAMPFVLSARLDREQAGVVEVETRHPDAFYNVFPQVVLEHGYRITAFESPDNNLESVFRYLVGGSGA